MKFIKWISDDIAEIETGRGRRQVNVPLFKKIQAEKRGNDSKLAYVDEVLECIEELNSCKAIKEDGESCGRTPQEGSEFCWQHQPE